MPTFFSGPCRGRCFSLAVLAFLLPLVLPAGTLQAAPSAAASEWARQVYQATGVQGGVVVHLSRGDVEQTAALQETDRFHVQGLYPDAARVAAARQSLLQRNAYGQTAVEQLRGSVLPYIENFVNLIVAEDSLGVSEAEMLRVLVPNGVAYIRAGEGWRKVIKPRPQTMDEWTHFLHSPSGNAVAHDDLVGPPDGMQWVGSPRWSRHHDRMASMSAMVSAGGRVFYIMDEGSRVSILLPSKWQLVARDAFNGAVLWRKEIPEWNSQLWPLKAGPTQLARRLVAVENRVYVTLGIDAPVMALDAATGDSVREYEESAGTEEILYDSRSLLMLVNRGEMEIRKFTPQSTGVETKRVETDLPWNEQPRELRSVDAATGTVQWTMNTKVAPLSLTADPEHVIFHDGDRLVCLDRKLGSVLWVSEPASRRKFLPFNFGPRVVLHGEVVLYAGGDGKMKAYSKKDGSVLWEANHPRSGYQSPQDLMVAGGLVWCAPTTSTGDSGVFTGRDPLTGAVKHEFPPDVSTYWFHHRCYIAKATDRFLIPSRTGIEFVDLSAKKWDINHWVRGGCLYGVMPCNGLTYAPPHDCACYPEAKLYGMNALNSGADNRRLARAVSDEGRLETGPAYADGATIDVPPGAADWPTYRHDAARSGTTVASWSGKLAQAWRTEIPGRLSAPVVAHGTLLVAQIDAHTVHSLDATTGQKRWSFSAGARVDSPPTYDRGRIVFGSADGYIYCLRAADGQLIWRFRAAPAERRLMAFEQIESVWPVHGSVLVENNVVSAVAGRSSFLDGGMRLVRLDVRTGKKLQEVVLDDVDPQSGKEMQERLQTLQMPVGLPDILSSDGAFTFLRSQRIAQDGTRLDLGPVSGNAAEQGGAQAGDYRHLFAPMGFLDDTYFHRAYWVFGRNFAGGHNGYFQAGKYTPSGRMLVNNDSRVFGFGRLPEYLKWTTTIEHQLFAAPKEVPQVPASAGKGRRAAANSSPVVIASVPTLDPSGKELTVEAWVLPDTPNGVVVAHGGPQNGYALVLDSRRPSFIIRANSELAVATSPVPISQGWNHLAGTLTKDGRLHVVVNGREVATARSANLIPALPKQSLELGDDSGGGVGAYNFPSRFGGLIDEVRVYHVALSEEQLALSMHDPEQARRRQPKPVLSLTFDARDAQDQSGRGHHGELAQAAFADGKLGTALRSRAAANQAGGSFVQLHWKRPVPLFARAMAAAGDTLLVAGPRDLQSEEESFKRLAQNDPEVLKLLQQQDDCMEGKNGSLLLAVSTRDGTTRQELELSHLPVWDGIAVVGNRVYVATADGAVNCYRAGDGE